MRFYAGLRVWKTGLAVIVSIFLCEVFHISNPLFAGIAAIICIQPTVFASIIKGVQRMQATILGAVCGVVIAYLLGDNPLAIGLAVIITILLCINFKWIDSLELAAIVALASMLGTTGGLISYGVSRVVSTFVGILVATLLNFFFFPPNYFKNLIKETDLLGEGLQQIFPLLESSFRNNDSEALKIAEEKIEFLDEQKNKVIKYYNYIRTDLEYQWLANQEIPKNQRLRWVWAYEKVILGAEEIFKSLREIIKVLKNRIERKQKLPPDITTPQFAAFLQSISHMLDEVGRLHERVLKVLISGNESEVAEIIRQAEEITALEREIPGKIKAWQCEYGSQYIESLMEISIISFELVQIAEAIKGMAEKVGYVAEKGLKANGS